MRSGLRMDSKTSVLYMCPWSPPMPKTQMQFKSSGSKPKSLQHVKTIPKNMTTKLLQDNVFHPYPNLFVLPIFKKASDTYTSLFYLSIKHFSILVKLLKPFLFDKHCFLLELIEEKSNSDVRTNPSFAKTLELLACGRYGTYIVR